MKQHDTQQHDSKQQAALFRQFMEELEPGAREYDRIMACGENPGAKRGRKRSIFRHAAAACLLAAVGTLAWVLWPTDAPGRLRQMAQTEEAKPASPKPQALKLQAAAEPKPMAEQAVGRTTRSLTSARPKQEPQPANVAGLEEEATTQDAPDDDRQRTAEIKEQIEAEVLRAILEKQLSMEVVKTALKNTEEPYQIQCSI